MEGLAIREELFYYMISLIIRYAFICQKVHNLVYGTEF